MPIEKDFKPEAELSEENRKAIIAHNVEMIKKGTLELRESIGGTGGVQEIDGERMPCWSAWAYINKQDGRIIGFFTGDAPKREYEETLFHFAVSYKRDYAELIRDVFVGRELYRLEKTELSLDERRVKNILKDSAWTFDVQQIRNRRQLDMFLDIVDEVKGTRQTYPKEKLKILIDRVLAGQEDVQKVPRTYGLRAKIKELRK